MSLTLTGAGNSNYSNQNEISIGLIMQTVYQGGFLSLINSNNTNTIKEQSNLINYLFN